MIPGNHHLKINLYYGSGQIVNFFAFHLASKGIGAGGVTFLCSSTSNALLQ